MFNRKRLLNNIRVRSANIQQSEFLQFTSQEIIERIQNLPLGNIDKILLIRDHGHFIASALTKNKSVKTIIHIEDEEDFEKYPHDLDLIIFPFGLHWTNKVQCFLQHCSKCLKNKGILIGNFAGAGTLSSLRQHFYEIESTLGIGHMMHVIPFIKFDHVTLLLKQCGFIESIVDIENIKLEFDNIISCMRSLKNTAHSNILTQHILYAISRNVYKKLQSISNDYFIEKVNLITFIACKEKTTIKYIN